jgi:hypothetical protein
MDYEIQLVGIETGAGESYRVTFRVTGGTMSFLDPGLPDSIFIDRSPADRQGRGASASVSTISVEIWRAIAPRTARPCTSRPVPDLAASPNHPWRVTLRERAESEHGGQDRLFMQPAPSTVAGSAHRCVREGQCP